MEVQRNFSLEALGGSDNFSSNASIKAIVLTDGILVTAGLIMLMENAISIALLWKCSRLPFQIRILTLNLAISDILTGFFLALPNTLLYETYQCDIKKYPCFLFINVSLLIVTMMNMDRCFVFAFAMRYYTYITERLLVKLCILAWGFGFVLTYGMFFGYDAPLGLSCELMAFLPKNVISMTFRCVIILIVVLNFLMFGYLVHHMRKSLLKVHAENDNLFSKRQSRTVRKISVFTGVFLASFSPFMIIYTFPVFDITSKVGKSIYTVSSSLVLLNSACNPVFYVWRFTEPRYHMKKLLCFWNKGLVAIIDHEHNQNTASYEINASSSKIN